MIALQEISCALSPTSWMSFAMTDRVVTMFEATAESVCRPLLISIPENPEKGLFIMFSLIVCSLTACAAKASTATWVCAAIQGAKLIHDICKDDD